MPKAKKSLGKKLKQKGAKKPGPVWKGPEEDGVTQSLLNKFIVCKERFRVRVVEGLVIEDKFSKSLGFGNMFHLCEETYNNGEDWEKALRKHTKETCEKYKNDQKEVVKWYEICRRQFPHYLDYWKSQRKKSKTESVSQEYVFRIPYELNDSGKIVWLRGKFDGTEYERINRKKVLFLKENKTSSEVDEQEITARMFLDQQTMFYLVALRQLKFILHSKDHDFPPVLVKDLIKDIKDNQPELFEALKHPIHGVNFNMVRRPLSGGKHSIRQKKPSKKNPKGQTLEEFYDELGDLIGENKDFFFLQLECEVEDQEISWYESHCLQPMLEDLCEWWDWLNEGDPFNPWLNGSSWRHYVTPFGIYNRVAQNKINGIDYYIKDGGRSGLSRDENLFSELTDDSD